jgi:hypothetical protein
LGLFYFSRSTTIYYNNVIRENEIIHIVAYNNYANSQQLDIIFSQEFVSIFTGLLNDKIDPKVRVVKSNLSAYSQLKLNMGSVNNPMG